MKAAAPVTSFAFDAIYIVAAAVIQVPQS